MRLRFYYFHMNPNCLEDSIADVCSGLGYSLVHLVDYPITTFVSMGPSMPNLIREWSKNNEGHNIESTEKVGRERTILWDICW